MVAVMSRSAASRGSSYRRRRQSKKGASGFKLAGRLVLEGRLSCSGLALVVVTSVAIGATRVSETTGALETAREAVVVTIAPSGEKAGVRVRGRGGRGAGSPDRARARATK